MFDCEYSKIKNTYKHGKGTKCLNCGFHFVLICKHPDNDGGPCSVKQCPGLRPAPVITGGSNNRVTINPDAVTVNLEIGEHLKESITDIIRHCDATKHTEWGPTPGREIQKAFGIDFLKITKLKLKK